MEKYTIIEKEPVKKEIEKTIKKINLKDRLFIFHTLQKNVKACPSEVEYKIKKGWTRKDWQGGTLEIYVNTSEPHVLIGSGSEEIGFCSSYHNPNNTKVMDFLLDDVLIEIYSDK